MNVLIVEDEFNCSEVLQTLLFKHVPAVKVTKVAPNIEEAKIIIEQGFPDIVFMDIQLGSNTCFELLDELKTIDFYLIFTTAYDQYALKAFEYAAVHYLLKPVVLSELKQAVERCIEGEVKTDLEDLEKIKKIYLRTSLKEYQINHEDILYIQADGSYSTVFTNDGKEIFTSKKLIDYQRQLTDAFFRIHHSIIVNLKWISHLDKKNNLVILSNGFELPISRRKKSEFRKMIE
jgi:two-component system LytT family response regulator